MSHPGITIGETSLSTLLSTLSVKIHPETYVFATIPASKFTAPFPIPLSSILLFFHEPSSTNGSSETRETREPSIRVTLILEKSLAVKHQIEHTYPCRMVTCDVHSSLEAVGFMAVLTAKLAEAGISTNPVSGYYHDHLFVEERRADDAVRVLERVRQDAAVQVR